MHRLWSICICSEYDMCTQGRLRAELSKERHEHERYERDIREVGAELQELNGAMALLEKFAREQYKMKRDDEDVFVFVPRK